MIDARIAESIFNAYNHDRPHADKVAALEARIAKLETPTPPPVTSERFEAVDFAKANAGHLFTGNLIGKGSAATTYAVKAGSSTKTPPTTGTNPLRVVRVGATSGALAPGVKVQGVTVEGYAGHNTHGLRATPATTPTA